MNKRIFGLICLSLICSSSSMSAMDAESSSVTRDSSSLLEPIEADSLNTNNISEPMETTQKSASRKLNSIEVRAAAFYPSGHTFREIYGNVGLSLQVEAARTLKNHKNIGIWSNIEWISMDGKSRGRCGSSSVDMFDFSFGVKGIGYFFDDSILLYAGIGPEVGFVYIENKIRCCTGCHTNKQHRSRVAVGGILKAGANVRLSSIFYLSFFGDYSYLPVHFSQTHNMGGGKVGGGLGARF